MTRRHSSSAARQIAETLRRATARIVRVVTRRVGRGNRLISGAYALAGRPEELMTVRTHGVRISLNLGDSVGHRLFYFGEFEERLTALLLSEFRSSDCFFDVGANRGYYSLLAAKRVGAVHAFEPNRALAASLRSDAAANGVDITVHEVGLADVSRLMGLATGSHPNSPEGTRYLSEPAGGETVRVVALDEWLPDARPTIIKIDVEGAELLALRGMRQTIVRARPRLITAEVVAENLARFGARPCDLSELMGSLGYLGQDLVEPSRDDPLVLVFRPSPSPS